MPMYHLRDNGPQECFVPIGKKCNSGGPQDHYTSRDVAERAFELKMEGIYGGEMFRSSTIETMPMEAFVEQLKSDLQMLTAAALRAGGPLNEGRAHGLNEALPDLDQIKVAPDVRVVCVALEEKSKENLAIGEKFADRNARVAEFYRGKGDAYHQVVRIAMSRV